MLLLKLCIHGIICFMNFVVLEMKLNIFLNIKNLVQRALLICSKTKLGSELNRIE